MQFSTDQSAGFQAAIAVANAEGYTGTAIGFGGAVSENVFINGTVGTSGSATGFSAAATYRFK